MRNARACAGERGPISFFTGLGAFTTAALWGNRPSATAYLSALRSVVRKSIEFPRMRFVGIPVNRGSECSEVLEHPRVNKYPAHGIGVLSRATTVTLMRSPGRS